MVFLSVAAAARPLSEAADDYRRAVRLTPVELRDLRTSEMLLMRLLRRPPHLSDLSDLEGVRRRLAADGRSPERVIDALHRVRLFAESLEWEGRSRC